MTCDSIAQFHILIKLLWMNNLKLEKIISGQGINIGENLFCPQNIHL